MKTLNKKQLFVYGIAGMGPNMLNLIVGTYLCDALLTVGFDKNIENWTYLNKALVVAVVWSAFITIAKIIDGIADVPLGALTDKLKTKWGKRRPSILLGMIPMVIAYLMMLIVPDASPAEGGSVLNTIWYFVWLAFFYTAYTLTLVTYYATYSEITAKSSDRIFLSNVKSSCDIIYFVLGYALIPMMVGSMNIRLIAIIFLPMVLTMLIPIFFIKERSTLPKDVEAYKLAHPEDKAAQIEEEPGMIKSIIYTFKNKDFIIWMAIYSILQFGLQMYLAGFNVYYSGTMGFTGMNVMIAQIAAFAPVTFTLILFNYISKKKGFKFSFQYALAIFSVGMLLAIFVRPSVFPDDTVRLIMAITANTICSFGIGAFFSVTYTVPSQIAADEVRATGKSHPAMYFAVQGLFGAVVSAFAVGLVWVNLKGYGVEVVKEMQLVEGVMKEVEVNHVISTGFFTAEAGGSGLLTLIVAISCILTFIGAFFLPKSLNNIGQISKDELKTTPSAEEVVEEVKEESEEQKE